MASYCKSVKLPIQSNQYEDLSMPWDEETQEFIYAERPNKTLIKKELYALQDLAKRIIALPDIYFEAIPLSESMRDAFLLARRIERAALQRQLRYIAGRFHEEEIDEIELTMARQSAPQKDAVERLHRVEEWRDKLISGDNGLLTDLVNQFEACDAQHLRQLIRNANKEIKGNKPPKSSRLIFKYLNDLDEQQNSDDT